MPVENTVWTQCQSRLKRRMTSSRTSSKVRISNTFGPVEDFVTLKGVRTGLIFNHLRSMDGSGLDLEPKWPQQTNLHQVGDTSHGLSQVEIKSHNQIKPSWGSMELQSRVLLCSTMYMGMVFTGTTLLAIMKSNGCVRILMNYCNTFEPQIRAYPSNLI